MKEIYKKNNVEYGYEIKTQGIVFTHTACPGSLDPYYIISFYIDWVKNSWAYGTLTIGLFMNYLISSSIVHNKTVIYENTK